jgi:citrate synthase
MSSGLVTTAEAAARLGVKRETIYAYVSRGILHRQVAMDGRTSLFDPVELDAVRLGKRDKTDGELRTVIATSITHVSDDALTVRGHDLLGLITQGRTFTEIADLLWLSSDSEQWPAPDASVATALNGVDGLRTIVAHVSATDPLRHDLSAKSVRAAGRRMITNMVHGLPAATGGSDRQLVLALWRRLTKRRGNAKERATLDAALALLVDHGLAGSTFAARVAASVRADPYSVVVSGLGVVGGSLHGAASGGVHTMFADAHRQRDASVAVGEALRKHGRVPGFGHSVYRRQDPRYGALMSRVIDAWGGDPKLDLVYQVRDVVNSRSDEFPNIDFALGAFTWLAAMAPEAGETIFAISRTSGWLAHAVEEYDERPLRFRPRARYLGLRPDD